MLSESELREHYLSYLEDVTNLRYDRENLPGTIKLALTQLTTRDPDQLGITSQKLHDMSMNYESSADFYARINKLVEPLCRPHLVGDKRKRLYRDV